MRETMMVLVGGLVLAALAYRLFLALDRRRPSVPTLERPFSCPDERLQLERHFATRRAFYRAAQAVSLFPHRIDRRAELVRHLLSLATAPEISADVPADDEQPEPPVPPRRPAPPANRDVPATDEGTDEGTDEETPVDAYREQGFL